MADFAKVTRVDAQGEWYISKYQIVAMNNYDTIRGGSEVILNTSHFGRDPLNVQETVEEIIAQFDE